MDEQWKEVEGFPMYRVSNYGYVQSLHTGHLLAMRPNSKGYMRVTLSREGLIQEFYLAQLVAKSFFPTFRPGIRIGYINGDLSNCSIWNLKMRKGRETREQIRENERAPWGKRVKIVETGETFLSVRHCAMYLGGDFSAIYSVLRGERHSHHGYTFEYCEE